MRKIIFVFSLVALASFLMNCGDKNNKTEEPLTPEENKVLIQSIGMEFVSEISGMHETKSVQTLSSFTNLVLQYDEEEGGRVIGNRIFGAISQRILAVSSREMSLREFGRRSARVSEDPVSEDPESLQELWDENKGVWNWNPDIEDFEFTEGGQVIQFNFPSTENGASNNASLTLRNYEGTVINNPLDEEYEGDLPVSLEIDLTVDGVTEMEYGFTIEYSNDGVPEKVDTELTMNPYTLTVGLISNAAKQGYAASLTKSGKSLIGISTELNGDFSDEALRSLDEDEDNIANIVSTANSSLTLLTFKLAAETNFKNLYNAVKDLDTYHYKEEGAPTQNFETNATKLESAMASHSKLTATYTDTGKKAADVEWYAFVEEDEWEIWISLGARLIFEDGSKVDVEDYFETGFDELEAEIEDLADRIEEDFGG